MTMTKKQQLSGIFLELEKGQNPDKFQKEIIKHYGNSKSKLVRSLIEASEGNNLNLNKWLFSVHSTFKGVVPWLAKVKTEEGSKFVWLTGMVDSEGQGKVREIINKSWSRIINDSLYRTDCKRPPFTVFLHLIESSQWQNQQDISSTGENAPVFGRLGMFVETNALTHNKPLTPYSNNGVNLSSDIEIFQDTISENNFTEDIDQKMPLSSDLFMSRTEKILAILKACCTIETVEFYEKSVLPIANIITKLHAEFHNHGHFLGPQSYTNKDKFEESYEAIEEFRACLIAGAITEHLEVEEEIIFGLPLHIFFMRYMGYGFEAIEMDKNDEASMREMEVGALFYNLLEDKRGLEIVNGKLHIYFQKLPLIFKNEVNKIHQLEEQNKYKGKDGLKEIAHLYRSQLINGDRLNAKSFYFFLISKLNSQNQSVK